MEPEVAWDPGPIAARILWEPAGPPSAEFTETISSPRSCWLRTGILPRISVVFFSPGWSEPIGMGKGVTREKA